MTAVPHAELLSPMTDHEPTTTTAETTVLVIDDDPVMWSMMSMLGREYGFAVKTTSDGVKNLQLAEQSDADLIVLDLNLPRMTGLDVCRRLRTAKIKIPIVIMSTNHDTVDIVIGLEIDADDYVAKPFKMRELATRISAQLRRQRRSTTQMRPGRLKFPDLIIDFGRHEMLRDDKVVALTPTEFNLLALLANRAGRVVSRSEMIQQVWNQGTKLDARSVDAHVYRLRRKMKPASKHPTYIHAVPKIGYRFDYRPPDEMRNAEQTA